MADDVTTTSPDPYRSHATLRSTSQSFHLEHAKHSAQTAYLSHPPFRRMGREN